MVAWSPRADAGGAVARRRHRRRHPRAGGAIVQQGQSLMRIDDTKFASEFGEIRERRAAMAARVSAIGSRSQGKERVDLPDQLDQVDAVRRGYGKQRVQDARAETGAGCRRPEPAGHPADRHPEIAGPGIGSDAQAVRAEGRAGDRDVAPRPASDRDERAARGSQSKIASTISSFRSQADEDLAKSRATWPCSTKTSNRRRTGFGEPT